MGADVYQSSNPKAKFIPRPVDIQSPAVYSLDSTSYIQAVMCAAGLLWWPPEIASGSLRIFAAKGLTPSETAKELDLIRGPAFKTWKELTDAREAAKARVQIAIADILHEPRPATSPVYDEWTELKPGVFYRLIDPACAMAVRPNFQHDGCYRATIVNPGDLQRITSVFVIRYGDIDQAWIDMREGGSFGDRYLATQPHPLEKATRSERWSDAAILLEELDTPEARELAAECRKTARLSHSTSNGDLHTAMKVRLEGFIQRQKEAAL